MIPGEYMGYLGILHGSFNTVVALLFLYQGSLGWRIRKERLAAGKRDAAIIKRHRSGGPILVVLGLAGYLAGVAIVYVDRGRVLVYPPHLIAGSCIALLLLMTFGISRLIKGLESPWKTPHFVIGIFILFLYLFQIYVGLNILL